MMRARGIEIRDSVFDPDTAVPEDKVQYRKGEPARYRVFLFADGSDLPYIASITYHLHQTFTDPVRTVRRAPSNPRCKLALWTWGIFDVRAVITDKKGDEYEVLHRLSYDRELKDLPADRFQAVAEDSGSSPTGRLRKRKR